MSVIAIDAGGSTTKFFDGKQLVIFPSQIGYDWRDRRIKSKYGDYDFEWSYEGQKGFAGTLAQHESDCSDSRKGDSKAHPDARLRVLLALHQYAEGFVHNIVVGQPIGKHTDTEKKTIKDMLIGRHTLAVNSVPKTFLIDRCEVAAEGVTAGLLIASNDLIRVIDIGSGTVNYGTLINRKLNDRGSFTLATGLETTLTNDKSAFARQIALRAIQGGWHANDKVYLCGGGAVVLVDELQSYFPNAKLIAGEAIEANVRAFYMIANKLYG